MDKWREEASKLADIMALWGKHQKGILLIDEVDMLLHPLRSELNFPLGERFALDFTQPRPVRWEVRRTSSNGTGTLTVTSKMGP